MSNWKMCTAYAGERVHINLDNVTRLVSNLTEAGVHRNTICYFTGSDGENVDAISLKQTPEQIVCSDKVQSAASSRQD